MTDYLEMSEVLELARTAADPVDRAGGMVEAERMTGVAAVLAKMAGDGQDDCEDCGCQIDPRRRAAAPWAIRCAPCQEVEDQKGRHRRG